MFDKIMRDFCKVRICNGKVRDPLTGELYCKTSKLLCCVCDHRIFNPCGTCAFYDDCNKDYKDNSVR